MDHYEMVKNGKIIPKRGSFGKNWQPELMEESGSKFCSHCQN